MILVMKLRKLGFEAELLSVGPAKPEKFKAKKDEKVGSAKQEKFKAKKGEKVGSAKQEKFESEKKVGSKCDTEYRGRNHYLGVQRAEAVGGFGGMNRTIEKVGSKCDTENRGRNHYLGVHRAEAVGGFGGMNRAIEDKEGSEKRIVEALAGFGGMNRAIEDKEGREKRIVEVVAGFGDFTSIEVDIKKGMVTVVGKSVPLSVALKVREMGYRAKLLSLGPTTEEEDTDEEHNDDLYPTYPDSIRYEDLIVEDVCTITCCFYFVLHVIIMVLSVIISVIIYVVISVLILYVLELYVSYENPIVFIWCAAFSSTFLSISWSKFSLYMSMFCNFCNYMFSRRSHCRGCRWSKFSLYMSMFFNSILSSMSSMSMSMSTAIFMCSGPLDASIWCFVFSVYVGLLMICKICFLLFL